MIRLVELCSDSRCECGVCTLQRIARRALHPPGSAAPSPAQANAALTIELCARMIEDEGGGEAARYAEAVRALKLLTRPEAAGMSVSAGYLESFKR